MPCEGIGTWYGVLNIVGFLAVLVSRSPVHRLFYNIFA